jgi:hypothetical protein
MTALDPRIILRIHADRANDLIVDHPGQPADYIHTDGTIWTWLGRWHIMGGAHVRSYDRRAPDGGNTLDVDVNLLPDLRGRRVVRFRPGPR